MMINIKSIFKPRNKTKETVAELILSCVSCWLLSVGTALVLDAQLIHQIGIVHILWQTFLAVTLSVLFTRRWWIPIIYFGVLVPVFFIAISLSGDIFSFFESFASFVKWWVSDMPIDSHWYSDQGFYLAHTIINIGVGILYFAVARIFKRVWVTVIVALAFVLANYAFGYTGYNYVAIPFFVVGIFPLITGEKFQKIKIPQSKNLFGVFGKKWMVILVCTFVSLIICMLSITPVIGNNKSVRTRLCSDAVADIQTVTNAYTNEQKKLNISLFDLGLVMNSTYVGGDLYSIKPEVLAATNLKSTALVKMTTFDTFDGKMWRNDFVKSYRINGLWKKTQQKYLSSSDVEDEDIMKNIEKIAYKDKITITLGEDSNFLPTIGQVLKFTEKTPTQNPVLFDERGRLLSYYGLKRDYSYSIETLVYPTEQEIMTDQIRSLLMNFSFEDDPLYDKQSAFYKQYTELPENVPEKIFEIIKELGFDTENAYEKAYKISRYFSTDIGYVYTEKPGQFKKGDNIIEKLLEAKQGHCMYYSTAVVIMARAAGIPARLAAGYRTVPYTDGKTQVIDKSSPYAWVECYIPHLGWMSFDPVPDLDITPPNRGHSTQSLGSQSALPNVSGDVDVEKDPNRKKAGTNLKWKEVFNVPLIVTLAIIGIIIILLVLNTIFSQKFYRLESVKKRYTNTKQQAEYYFQDILRQLLLLRFRLKRGETLNELIGRVCVTNSQYDSDMLLKSIEMVNGLHYGEITPDQEGIALIAKTHTMLEQKVKNTVNPVVYTILRRTLLPIFSIAANRYKDKK